MEIERIFGAGGVLEHSIPGFQMRDGQVSMARTVLDAINGRKRAVIEGGTGLGKTYAYLVPLLITNTEALISTGTRNLQDQLFEKDIPELARALGRSPDVKVLKGRQNYLCKLRLERGRELPLEDGQEDEWRKIEIFAQTTKDGDLDSLDTAIQARDVRAMLASTRESCPVRECAHYESCHFYEARRAARQAQIVVVNHHLYLADFSLREEEAGEILPETDVVVLDEAHQLPQTATACFSRKVSTAAVVRQMRRLLKEADAVRKDNRPTKRVLAAVNHLHRQVCAGAVGAAPPGRGESPAQVSQHDLEKAEGFAARLGRFCDAVSDAAHAIRSDRELPPDLRGQSAGIAETMDHVRMWIGLEPREGAVPRAGEEEGQDDTPLARWADIRDNGITFNSAPVEVGNILGRHFAEPERAFVFTSATLSTGGSLEPFAESVGLEEPVQEIRQSPFDYAGCSVLLVPEGMPTPRGGSTPEHAREVVDVSYELAKVNGGRAFILFTNLGAMGNGARMLRERLKPEGISVLVQGEDGNARLMERFRSGERCVLVGSHSFSMGIDIKGAGLSLVVFDKLPFMPPTDPLLLAREEHCKAEGKNPFSRLQIPHVILSLKQAAGRLIRTPTDRGVFVLCDPRLTESYGRRIRESLPPMRFTRDIEDAKEMLRSIR